MTRRPGGPSSRTWNPRSLPSATAAPRPRITPAPSSARRRMSSSQWRRRISSWWRAGGGGGGHRVNERSEQPVSRHEVHLVPCQSLGARLGPRETARASRRPVQERDAKTLRERGRDHASAGAIGGRHGDKPGLIRTHDYLSFAYAATGAAAPLPLSVRTPGRSISPHMTAAPAKIAAPPQNATV